MEQCRNVFLSEEQADCRKFPFSMDPFLYHIHMNRFLFPSPQAISCLKKALWLCPLNFNVLYNLGVVLMTAHQFASAFQCFVSAVSIRSEDAESFMMLASE
jgi:predicted Zn-dependent protease